MGENKRRLPLNVENEVTSQPHRQKPPARKRPGWRVNGGPVATQNLSFSENYIGNLVGPRQVYIHQHMA
jgi:hypothetical protein